MLGRHSFGEELRSCTFGDIRVAETAMPPELVLEEHAHEAGQICFVLEGSYQEWTSDGGQVLQAGDVQFHAPGERHANRFSAEEALTLLISVERRRWLDVTARRPLPRAALLTDLAADVRQELRRDDAASAAALEGLGLLTMSRVARLGSTAPAREPEFLAEAVFVIGSSYGGPISLRSVADTVGVHRATLAAAFRRFRGTSAGDFIRSVRVARAAAELRAGSAPIADIAQRTGFADQAHLGRVFKRATGMTPAGFRRRARG